MNIGKAFDRFLKQSRVIDKVIINPEDVSMYNLEKSHSGKLYKWTSEVVLDENMDKGCFELVSNGFNSHKQLKERFC